MKSSSVSAVAALHVKGDCQEDLLQALNARIAEARRRDARAG